MLEADAREHDDGRVEHVRGVPAAAEPGLDHGRPPRRRSAKAANAAAVSSSNCVTLLALLQAALDLPRRLDHPLHRAAEPRGVRSAHPDTDALGEGRQVRREVLARAHPVRLEHRGGEARRRALAVRADDVDRAEHAMRAAERREQPAHALQAEAHAEQLAREEVLLSPFQRPGHRAPPAARQLVALLGHHGLRRVRDELLVGELALGALRSPPRASRRRFVRAPRLRLEIDVLGREKPTAPARATTSPSAHSSRARRARCGMCGPDPASRVAGRMAPGRTSRASRQPRTVLTVSIASAISASAASSTGEARAGQRLSASRPSCPCRPDLLGDERDQRVRHRQRLREHVARATPPSVSRRGLTISRYQSHSSP